MKAAHEAALKAYAPYSKFLVGAALRTKAAGVVIGSNQENASFPAGICAERTALHGAMARTPLRGGDHGHRGALGDGSATRNPLRDLPARPCWNRSNAKDDAHAPVDDRA